MTAMTRSDGLKVVEGGRPTVISAIPTAFTENGSLDIPGTTKIMEHALRGGVDSLFLAGTTAEFPALSPSEVVEVFDAGLAVAGPERVVAHVGGASARQAQELAHLAVTHGVQSLAAITPYYLPAGPAAVFDYFSAVRDAAGSAKLYAYLFPDRTGVHLNTDETAELVEALDLEGIKLSGLSTDFVQQLVSKLSSQRLVYSGSDGLISSVFSAGGAGVVSGVSSAFPAIFRQMADAMESRDRAAEGRLQVQLDDAVRLVGPSIWALKIALRCLGVIENASCRMAMDRITPTLESEIKSLVESVSN